MMERIAELLNDISEKTEQLGQPNWLLITTLSLSAIVLLVIFWNAEKLSARHNLAVKIVALFFAVRIALFFNPFSWIIYHETLEWPNIGFRETAVIDTEIRSYLLPPENLEYLAIGSSQVGSVFTKIAQSDPTFYKIEMSGMSPLDYYLYRDLVRQTNPRAVILFLSEFDFGRKTPIDTLKYAPFQGLGYIALKRIAADFDLSELSAALPSMLIGSLTTEYKYSFVLDGYLDLASRKHARTSTSQSAFASSTNAEKRTVQLKSLSKSLSSANIAANIAFLRLFLNDCKDAGQMVYIVEGQYHPGAYSPSNVQVNLDTVASLQQLATDFDNVEFLPRSVTGEFEVDDYIDGYHVNKDAGYEFSQRLVKLLEVRPIPSN